MNNISQNIRYYPHDLNTKFYSIQIYSKVYPLSVVCRNYHISKSSLLRWAENLMLLNLIDKFHRPLSKKPRTPGYNEKAERRNRNDQQRFYSFYLLFI